MSDARSKSPFVDKLRRLLVFGRAVMRHGWVLLSAILSSFVFSIPSWIGPLLSPSQTKRLSAFIAISPQISRHLALASFAVCVLWACFLAWDEERGELIRTTKRVAELQADKPELTGHIRRFQTFPAGLPSSGIKSAILVVDIELINSGAATSVSEWQGFYRRRDGSRVFLSTAMFVDDVREIEGRRNLVLDDWHMRKGERRLGAVAFYLSQDEPNIAQVAVQFQDYLGRVYSAAFPWE